jgi:hypothetical protein
VLTAEQRKRHLRNLDLLRPTGDHDYDAQTRTALRQVWEDGSQPATIALRPGFVVRDTPLPGAMSDKDPAPATVNRPPLARLVAPRGVALRLELIALFVAQCGHGASSVANTALDPVDGVGWRHLVLGPSTYTPHSSAAMTQKDNRVRQIRTAFDKLAITEIGLMELPGAGQPSGRYARPRLLVENGTRSTGAASRYRQPQPGASVVTVPANFFLNGWVHVLDDAEIAAWLMFRHRTQLGISVLDGEDRLALYTLRLPTWRKHRALDAYRLLEVQADPNRRYDGTMEDRPEHGDGQLHRFAMTDAGLDNLALDVVRATL